MSSQDFSDSLPFSLQAFEELLQVVSPCSPADTSSALPETVDGVTATLDKMHIGGTRSSFLQMFSFLTECSKSEFLLEGVLAVSVASIDSPFWFAPSDGLSSDYSVKDVVASVVNECIEVLKAVGATSEQTALTMVALGRTLAGGVGQKLPKDQKLRSVLQGVPGVVLCGDLQSRSGPNVYFAASEAPTSAANSLPPKAEPSLSLSGAVARLRESSDLAAAVCALLCLWYESPRTQSEFHKACRKMHVNPKACIDAIQRVNALVRALLQVDGNRLPEAMFLQGTDMKTRADLREDASCQFKFLPVHDRQMLFDRATACASLDSAATSHICNVAVSHFQGQVFEVFSSFGDVKCRIVFPDGSFAPASVPLQLSLSSGQSCLGCYMGTTVGAANTCIGVSCATLTALAVSRAAPLRTEIICASALAIDRLQASYAWPSHPACIISRTSRMEISLYGPGSCVAEAGASVRDALSKVTAALVAVPLVVGEETGLLGANHRAVFGAGFRTTCIMGPEEFNVVEVFNVVQYLFAVSGKLQYQRAKSGCTLSDVKEAFKRWCLDELFPPPFSESHPFAVDVKVSNEEPVIFVSFASSAAAAAACALISQLPHSPLLQIASASSAIMDFDPSSSFRVGFCVSNIQKSEGQLSVDEKMTSVREKTVSGRKFYAVDMMCCNKSGWHLDEPVPDPDQAEDQMPKVLGAEEQERSARDRCDIARASCKSAFTTHHAHRRNRVRRAAFVQYQSNNRPSCENMHVQDPQNAPQRTDLVIHHDVFAHSGHKCVDCCPVSDGPHRRTCDDLPRWSCCDAPFVDRDSNLFCNERPPKPFDSFTPKDLCHYCWETHYFLSQSDAEEACETFGAKSYREMVAAFEARQKEKEERRARGALPGKDGPHRTPNQFCLSFLDAKSAEDAFKLITHVRQLPFSLGTTSGSQDDKCLFSFENVRLVQGSDKNAIEFSLKQERERKDGKCQPEKHNVPLFNRHILLGTLKHWGCSGIASLDVLGEAITASNAGAFLSGIARAAASEIEATLAAKGISQSEYKIRCDPTSIVRVKVKGSDSVDSFVGLHGVQTLSFAVQMGSDELCRGILPDVQLSMLGSVRTRQCEGASCDVVCCDVRPDTSKCVFLPADATHVFVSDLLGELEEIRLKHPKSILSWTAVSADAAAAMRPRLVLECSDEGLVDHALGLLRCYIDGIRLVPDASSVWWFHTEEGRNHLTALQSSCVDIGVCMSIQSSSAVTFYGASDKSKRMHGLLQDRLTALKSEKKSSEVEIAVTLPQLNRFIKRHRSLRAAAQAFSPHVQQMRATHANGKWQLIITACPEGVKSVRDDVLMCQMPDAASGSENRYQCLICGEGSDTLSDEWLVSLRCSCILHVPCARLWYGCDEEDPMDPLKPKRLFPLDCFALDSASKKCGKQLAQLDIAELVQDAAQLHRRVTEELTRFASIPSSGWRACPVPTESIKCQMLYRPVANTKSWSTRKCEGCGFEHCASCEGAPHAHGMSCREATGGIVSEDPFANLDPSRFGRCPTCTMIIERAEACAHIICTRCNTHFHLKN